MKKTVLSLLFVAASTSVFAQFSIGPKLGLGISTFKNTKIQNGSTYSYSSIVTPQIGAVANIQLGDIFALRPELLFLQRGGKQNLPGGSVTYRASYIELPINVAAGLQAGPGKVEVFVGPAIGYSLGGNYKASASNGLSQSGSIIAKKEPSGYSGNAYYMNPLNISLNFGLDYKFDNGLLIQVSYNLGLTNTAPHFADSNLESNRSQTVVKASAVNFGVAYLFGGK